MITDILIYIFCILITIMDFFLNLILPRKLVWSKDYLLRNPVNKYGHGKWAQIKENYKYIWG